MMTEDKFLVYNAVYRIQIIFSRFFVLLLWLSFEMRLCSLRPDYAADFRA